MSPQAVLRPLNVRRGRRLTCPAQKRIVRTLVVRSMCAVDDEALEDDESPGHAAGEVDWGMAWTMTAGVGVGMRCLWTIVVDSASEREEPAVAVQCLRGAIVIDVVQPVPNGSPPPRPRGRPRILPSVVDARVLHAAEREYE